jgi:hypothetical protein
MRHGKTWNNNLTIPIDLSEDGKNKVDRKETDWCQGSKEASSQQGSKEDSSSHWWGQETSQIQTRHCGTKGDQEVPKEHRPTHQEVTIPETGP